MVQQGSVYYERCQAAELNPDRTVDERRECWTAWTQYYAPGQPLERRAYAQERRVALAMGDEIEGLPDSEGYGPPHLDPPVHTAHVERITSPDVEPPQADPPDASPPNLNEPHADPSAEGSSERQRVSQQPERPSLSNTRFFAVRPPEDAVPSPPPSPPELEGSIACSSVCNPRWDTCIARCSTRGAPCRNACENSYAICTSGCH